MLRRELPSGFPAMMVVPWVPPVLEMQVPFCSEKTVKADAVGRVLGTEQSSSLLRAQGSRGRSSDKSSVCVPLPHPVHFHQETKASRGLIALLSSEWTHSPSWQGGEVESVFT